MSLLDRRLFLRKLGSGLLVSSTFAILHGLKGEDELDAQDVVPNRRKGVASSGGGASNGLLAATLGYWKMDENVASGSRADATGNGWTATDPGANVGNTTGALNLAANFDAITKGLVISAAIDARSETAPFSWSFWYHPLDIRAGNGVLAAHTLAGVGGLLIYGDHQAPDSQLRFWTMDDTNTVTDTDTVTHPNTGVGVFNHYVFIFDGTKKFAYLNNVQLLGAGVSVAGVSRGTANITLANYTGSIGSTTGESYIGDEYALFNKALNAGDVNTLFNGGSPLPFSSFS